MKPEQIAHQYLKTPWWRFKKRRKLADQFIKMEMDGRTYCQFRGQGKCGCVGKCSAM